MDNNMKNISVRLTFVDIQRMKELSMRLGIRESDLFRFSVKNVLEKLVLLNDKNVKGADLIPIWLECGDFLMDHFELDIERLNEIFNLNVTDASQRVDMEDIELMAMSKLNPIYMVKKLSSLCKKPIDLNSASEVFRKYLYNKYILDTHCDCSQSNSLPQLNLVDTQPFFKNFN